MDLGKEVKVEEGNQKNLWRMLIILLELAAILSLTILAIVDTNYSVSNINFYNIMTTKNYYSIIVSYFSNVEYIFDVGDCLDITSSGTNVRYRLLKISTIAPICLSYNGTYTDTELFQRFYFNYQTGVNQELAINKYAQPCLTNSLSFASPVVSSTFNKTEICGQKMEYKDIQINFRYGCQYNELECGSMNLEIGSQKSIIHTCIKSAEICPYFSIVDLTNSNSTVEQILKNYSIEEGNYSVIKLGQRPYLAVRKLSGLGGFTFRLGLTLDSKVPISDESQLSLARLDYPDSQVYMGDEPQIVSSSFSFQSSTKRDSINLIGNSLLNQTQVKYFLEIEDSFSKPERLFIERKLFPSCMELFISENADSDFITDFYTKASLFFCEKSMTAYLIWSILELLLAVIMRIYLRLYLIYQEFTNKLKSLDKMNEGTTKLTILFFTLFTLIVKLILINNINGKLQRRNDFLQSIVVLNCFSFDSFLVAALKLYLNDISELLNLTQTCFLVLLSKFGILVFLNISEFILAKVQLKKSKLV